MVPFDRAERCRTTPLERFLLFIVAIALPFENSVASISGRSILFFLYAAIGLFLGFTRPESLIKTALQPIYLAGAAFVLVAFACESGHLNSDYTIAKSIFQMLLGSIMLASMCRDQRALATLCFGF